MTWLDDAISRATVAAPNIGTRTLDRVPLWRVYSSAFEADAFNGTNKGWARFSPLVLSTGKIVPTMYLGSSLDVALMEIVLRNAPMSPQSSSGYILAIERSKELRRVACLEPSAPLTVVDLSTLGLRRLGLSRSDVIDCDQPDYPITQQLAAWLYENHPTVQGIGWTSRQNDNGQAYVLFAPRLGKTSMHVLSKDEVFTSGPHHDALILLADSLGAMVRITP